MAVAKRRVGAVEAAEKKVSGEQCARFEAMGCKKAATPPCAPPLPPQCSKGRCV